MTDFPDWQALPSLASILASGAVSGAPGGVPLLTFENVLLNQTVTVAAGSSNTFSPVAVPQIAYNALVQLKENVSGTTPLADIAFSWQDAVSLLQVRSDTYQTWIGAPSASHSVYGFGPSRANQLVVTIKNLDSQAITASVLIISESRIYPYDIWRSVRALPVISGQTGVQCRPESNILAYNVSNIGAGVTDVFALPMWIGACNLFVATGSGVADCTAKLQYLDTNQIGSTFTVFDQNTSASGLLQAESFLPRNACLLSLKNGNAAAQNISYTLTAIERQ